MSGPYLIGSGSISGNGGPLDQLTFTTGTTINVGDAIYVVAMRPISYNQFIANNVDYGQVIDSSGNVYQSALDPGFGRPGLPEANTSPSPTQFDTNRQVTINQTLMGPGGTITLTFNPNWPGNGIASNGCLAVCIGVPAAEFGGFIADNGNGNTGLTRPIFVDPLTAEINNVIASCAINSSTVTPFLHSPTDDGYTRVATVVNFGCTLDVCTLTGPSGTPGNTLWRFSSPEG